VKLLFFFEFLSLHQDRKVDVATWKERLRRVSANREEAAQVEAAVSGCLSPTFFTVIEFHSKMKSQSNSLTHS